MAGRYECSYRILRYVYPAGGRVDVWRIVPVAAGLGSLPFFHGEWCRIPAALIQTVTNNEIMFSLHGVYVTTGKCGTFARVVAAFPTVDVKLSAEVMGCKCRFSGGRMGKLTLLLLALLVWLQYSLWFGKNGIHDYSRVNDDVAAQQATNAKLKARNDQLFAEIDDLNGGQEAIEERARNELSMTKPGETFYRLVPDASKRAQTTGQNNR